MASMKFFRRGGPLAVILVVLAIYIPIVLLSGLRSQLGEVINALRFAFAVAVLIAYWPLILAALRKKVHDDADYLILGIGFGWLAWTALSIWSFYGRVNGFSVSLTESAVTDLFGLFTILSSILHLTAPYNAPRGVAYGGWRWSYVVAAVSFGSLLAGIILSSAFWAGWLFAD